MTLKADIRAEADRLRASFEARGAEVFEADILQPAGALLNLEHVESVRLRDEASIELETRDLAAFQEVFAPLAAEQRAGVVSVVSDDSSLEAVFDYLVG